MAARFPSPGSGHAPRPTPIRLGWIPPRSVSRLRSLVERRTTTGAGKFRPHCRVFGTPTAKTA